MLGVLQEGPALEEAHGVQDGPGTPAMLPLTCQLGHLLLHGLWEPALAAVRAGDRGLEGVLSRL
eukprot:7747333-Lingulodinium_polyedra.AAC.1